MYLSSLEFVDSNVFANTITYLDDKFSIYEEVIGPDGKKRAYVKFSAETPAIDIATQLGLM